MDKSSNNLSLIILNLKLVFRSVLTILIVLFVTPLALIILSPLYLIRFVVRLIAKCTRPDLGPMLEARSTFEGLNCVKGNPNPPGKIQCTFLLEGDVDKDQLIKEVQAAMQIKRSNGTIKNHQLTEYLVPFMGFLFWKPESNFKLDSHILFRTLNKDNNHIIEITNPKECREISYEQLQTIEQRLINIPFGHERSPWDFHIIPNVRPRIAKEGLKYTAVVFRNHHCLADGYSVLKFVFNDVSQNPKDLLVHPKFPKLSFAHQICRDLYALIKVPFDIVNAFAAKPDVNPWHLPPEKLYGNSKFYLVESHPIPVEYFKEIKRQSGVPIVGIVTAIATGAIREMMMIKNLKLPDWMTSVVPFPYPGHPDKLGNYWSAAVIPLPVGTSDSKDRLKYIQKAINQLKHSTAALTMFKVQLIFGALFYKLLKSLAQFRHSTVLVSDFPGPTKEGYLLGQKCVDGHFIVGFPSGNTGLLFFSSSYNGLWKIKIMVDHGILQSQEDAQIMMDKMMDELKKLRGHLEV